MVWSVDQDDEKFSALECLTGRDLTDFNEQLKKSQITDTGHWASLNGQKCKLSECGGYCEAGWAMAPNGGKIKDNCGGAGDRIVCCPVDSMPSACVSKDTPSEARLTKNRYGVAVKAVDRAMVNATRARVPCSTHDMPQLIVIDQASKPTAARPQASKP